MIRRSIHSNTALAGTPTALGMRFGSTWNGSVCFGLEQPNYQPEQRDLELETKLEAEWPAILRWMIDGCLDWQKNGLVRPPVVIETDDGMRIEERLGKLHESLAELIRWHEPILASPRGRRQVACSASGS